MWGQWSILRKIWSKQINIFLLERKIYILRIGYYQETWIYSTNFASGLSRQGSAHLAHLRRKIWRPYLIERRYNRRRNRKMDRKNVTLRLESVKLLYLWSSILNYKKINIHEAYPELQFKSLFKYIRTFLTTIKWNETIRKHPKLAINQLCGLLKPIYLKEKLFSDLTLDKRLLMKTWTPFEISYLKVSNVTSTYS